MSRFSLGVTKLRRDDRYAVPSLDRTINLGENVFHCPEQGRAQGTDWARMPATNLASPRISVRVRFRLRWLGRQLCRRSSLAVGAALPSEQPCSRSTSKSEQYWTVAELRSAVNYCLLDIPIQMMSNSRASRAVLIGIGRQLSTSVASILQPPNAEELRADIQHPARSRKTKLYLPSSFVPFS